MSSITEDFSDHFYASSHDIYDLSFYDWFKSQYREYVMKCIRCISAADKRLVPGEFGDLQDETTRIAFDNDFNLAYTLLPESVTVFTTDYMDRPETYAKNVKLTSDKKCSPGIR